MQTRSVLVLAGLVGLGILVACEGDGESGVAPKSSGFLDAGNTGTAKSSKSTTGQSSIPKVRVYAEEDTNPVDVVYHTSKTTRYAYRFHPWRTIDSDGTVRSAIRVYRGAYYKNRKEFSPGGSIQMSVADVDRFVKVIRTVEQARFRNVDDLIETRSVKGRYGNLLYIEKTVDGKLYFSQYKTWEVKPGALKELYQAAEEAKQRYRKLMQLKPSVDM